MKRARDPREQDERERLIDGLMRTVLDNRDAAQVLDYCCRQTGVGSAFLDLESGEWASGSADEEFLERCRFYPLAEILRLYRHWRIASHGVSGYLVADSSFTEKSLFCQTLSHITNAILLCGTSAGSAARSSVGGRRLLRRLIDAKPAPPEELKRLEDALQREQVPMGREFVMVSLFADFRGEDDAPACERTGELFRRCERFLAGIAPHNLCDASGMSFCAAVFREKRVDLGFVWNNLEEIYVNCARHAGAGPRFRAVGGIGGIGRAVADFAVSHAQSELAAKYAAFERRRTFFCDWEDIGGSRLFAQMQETERSHQAFEELRTFEKAKKTPFFSTFAALVRNSWNLTATARELSLHYNSLKYRYDRIGEILNIDLDDERNRFELSLLLRTYLYSLPMQEFFETVSI